MTAPASTYVFLLRLLDSPPERNPTMSNFDLTDAERLDILEKRHVATEKRIDDLRQRLIDSINDLIDSDEEMATSFRDLEISDRTAARLVSQGESAIRRAK